MLLKEGYAFQSHAFPQATSRKGSNNTASSATTPNVDRQPSMLFNAPPSNGENPGAAAIATMINDSARANASPSNRSRAIASDNADVAHTPIACTMRPTTSCVRSSANAQTTLPSTKSTNPLTTNHLRPKRSDKGPTKSWPTAKATKKLASVALKSLTEVCSSPAISGNAGRMMLVANEPSAARPASRSNNCPVSCFLESKVFCIAKPLTK